MVQHRISILIFCLLFVVLVALPAPCQEPTGRIEGTVRAAGNPLGRVSVTIASQESGVRRVVVSSADGAYAASGLPPGSYTVSVDMQGFRSVVHKDQVLAAGASLVLDLELEPRFAEEITVTAMKHEDTLQNTPFSIAAPSTDVLRDLGALDIEGVAQHVVNFSVQNLGPGQSQVAIRGVSSGQIARDQPGVKEQVGAYLDESVVSLSLYTPDFDLFDMARVEVLRGPQGTLFGSGSLAGTVRYITNQPELGATRFFGEVEGTTQSGGNKGAAVKAGMNVPLGGASALRVAAYYDHLGGYIDAIQPSLEVDHDVNGGRRAGVRTALTFAPSARLTITPRLVYQDLTMQGWNRVDAYNLLANPFTTTRPPVSFGEREEFIQLKEPFSDEFYLGDLNIRYDLGQVELTSITSYIHRDIVDRRDTTALTASFTGGNLGLPESVYTLDSPLDDLTNAHSWSQELRFSAHRDRLAWVAGGFYADARRDFSQNVQLPGFEDATGTPTQGILAPRDSIFFSVLGYELEQYALFGEATYAFNDRFDLTFGLRYYHFSEDKEQIFDGVFANPQNGVALLVNQGETDSDGVAPRLIASYKLGYATKLNAQISKGFRLGGINDPLNVLLCTPQDLVTFGGRAAWKDETAWNYEVGSKSTLFGGRGSLNVAAFYVDVEDLQTTVTAGTCSSRLVYNVPSSRSVGGEVEFTAEAGSHLELSASAGYSDAKLRSTLTSTATDGTVSVVSGIEAGRRLPSVPQLQLAAAITYNHALGRGYLGYATAAYSYVGSRYTQVGDEDPGFGTIDLLALPNTIGGPLTQTTFTFDPLLPAYDIVNLRLGVRHGRWDVGVFVDNLTDERALLALERERGKLARLGYLTNAPRRLGFSARLAY